MSLLPSSQTPPSSSSTSPRPQDLPPCVHCVLLWSAKSTTRPGSGSSNRNAAHSTCNRTITSPCDYCMSLGFVCIQSKTIPFKETKRSTLKTALLKTVRSYDEDVGIHTSYRKTTFNTTLRRWLDEFPLNIKDLPWNENERFQKWLPTQAYDMPWISHTTWNFDTARYLKLSQKMEQKAENDMETDDTIEEFQFMQEIDRRLSLPSIELSHILIELLDKICTESRTDTRDTQLSSFTPDSVIGLGLLAQELIFQENDEHRDKLLTLDQVRLGPNLFVVFDEPQNLQLINALSEVGDISTM